MGLFDLIKKFVPKPNMSKQPTWVSHVYPSKASSNNASQYGKKASTYKAATSKAVASRNAPKVWKPPKGYTPYTYTPPRADATVDEILNSMHPSTISMLNYYGTQEAQASRVLPPGFRDGSGAGAATHGSTPYYGGSGGYGGGYGGGGGGYGEPAVPPPVTWSSFDAGIAGAPAWWKAMKPSSFDPASEYMATANMLIPFLSPEDQRTVAAALYQQDSTNFGYLAPEKIGTEVPGEITPALKSQFTGSARASNALTALGKLLSATGKSENDLGAGYRYLKSIISAVNQFGATPGSGQTRTQYQSLMSALDPLLSQSQSGDLSPYGPIARAFSQPFFSAGQVVPISKTSDGRYIFGVPNKSLL